MRCFMTFCSAGPTLYCILIVIVNQNSGVAKKKLVASQRRKRVTMVSEEKVLSEGQRYGHLMQGNDSEGYVSLSMWVQLKAGGQAV